MFGKAWIAALAALVMCAQAALAAPLEAYGRLPTLSQVTISPDGKALAYVAGTEADRLVMVQSLVARQVLGALHVGQTKVRDLNWADDHTLLITTSVTAMPMGGVMTVRRHEFFSVLAYDIQTKTQRALLDHFSAGHLLMMNVVAGTPTARVVDGQTSVFVPGIYFSDGQGRTGLFRIDLPLFHTALASNIGNKQAEDWVIDARGNVIAESSYDEDHQRWKMTLDPIGKPRPVLDLPAPIESPSMMGLDEDGGAVVITTPESDGSITYQAILLKDGSIVPWKHANPAFRALVTSETGAVVGGALTTEKNDYTFFDQHTDTVWRSVKAAFKDATNVDLVSWTTDRTKVVAHVLGEAYGNGYFLVDMTAHRADPIGREYDGIDEVAPEKWIEYAAGDGRKINAYLTLPLKRSPKNLPLIVLPHGGPHARDYPGFDWISQALASRGYAVLQPEFRGSDGFGLDLLTAGFGEFGKKMQTDLSDGVRALAAQGLIDPKRVCIVGASYGGYAALAGATLDTGVYRCAVSIAGLSDLKALLSYMHWPRNRFDDRGERFWDRFLNVSNADDPKLDAISPIKHVDKVTIPILLIHGRDDTRVPFSQSSNMADALEAAHKPVEFVKLSGEDHWLSKSQTRLEMLEATVKFLEANNPPN